MSAELPTTVVSMASAADSGVGMASPEPRQVSQFDVASFRSAMEAGLAQAPGSTSAAEPVSAPGSLSSSSGFRTVVGMLENLNGDVRSINAEAAPFTEGIRDMSPGDMLNLTVRCHEFLFHCQLTSNAANRTSDGVQQLFRQQS